MKDVNVIPRGLHAHRATDIHSKALSDFLLPLFMAFRLDRALP
jgi:hypothetical protein